MARPRKNNAEYFSHDADMRNHRKIIALRNKFGMQGYGIWCMLLETLCDSNDNEIDFSSEIEQELISGDMGVSVTELKQVVDFCLKVDLLQAKNNGNIHSESMDERLIPVYEKRERARKAYDDAVKRRKQGKSRVSVTETTQSKVKESKVNKSNNKGHKNGQVDFFTECEQVFDEKLQHHGLDPLLSWTAKEKTNLKKLTNQIKSAIKQKENLKEVPREKLIEALEQFLDVSATVSDGWYLQNVYTPSGLFSQFQKIVNHARIKQNKPGSKKEILSAQTAENVLAKVLKNRGYQVGI